MGIVGNIKDVAQVMQKVGNVELYQKLLGIQEKALKLVGEKARLQKEIQELRDKFVIKESLVFKNESYWMKTEVGESGPFCSHCWDTKQLTVRMKRVFDFPESMKCPACKNQYCVYPEKQCSSPFENASDEDFDRNSII